MKVAHGVHHQDIDVCIEKQNQKYDYRGIVTVLTTRQEEHVLDETSKHMPRFEVHKRAEEVEPYKYIHVINKDL